MSIEDKEPSQDTAREVFPLTMFDKGGNTPNMTDFRAVVLPADAPEEVEPEAVPKASSAPEPVVISESPKTDEPKAPVKTAPAAAAKASGPNKASGPGLPPSSAPKTTGS